MIKLLVLLVAVLAGLFYLDIIQLGDATQEGSDKLNEFKERTLSELNDIKK